jgi:hypothetical protein
LPQIARRTNLNFANIGTGQGKTNIAAFVGLYTRLFFEKWSEWQQQKWWKENKNNHPGLGEDPFAVNDEGQLIQKLPAEVPKRIQYRTVVVLPTPQLAAEMLSANRKFYDQFPGQTKGYSKNCQTGTSRSLDY